MSDSETVLVVDSDSATLRDISLILSARGYELLTACNGSEAIRRYECSRSPVHLVLTAVMMPGLSGFELAESLKQWNRRLPVVFMSEHNREILFAENAHPPACFLRKPFDEPSLLQKVRDAMSERRMPAATAALPAIPSARIA